MKQEFRTIREELITYAMEELKQWDFVEWDDINEIHHRLFNEDYYIIGYYQCEEWLKKHNVSVFDGIAYCNEMEELHFGEVYTKLEDAEKLVNNLVYWISYELMEDIKGEHLEYINNQF